CLTFNFEESTKICELNDADHSLHENDLRKAEGFVYVDIKRPKKSEIASTSVSPTATNSRTIASPSATQTTSTSTAPTTSTSTTPTTRTSTTPTTSTSTTPTTSTSTAPTTRTSTTPTTSTSTTPTTSTSTTPTTSSSTTPTTSTSTTPTTRTSTTPTTSTSTTPTASTSTTLTTSITTTPTTSTSTTPTTSTSTTPTTSTSTTPNTLTSTTPTTSTSTTPATSSSTTPPTFKPVKLKNSTILRGNNKYLKKLTSFLKPVLQDSNRSRWIRCWRAATDGWDVDSTFHRQCDNKGPTVTIVRVSRYIFGGYSDVSWDSSSGWTYSNNAFLFSMYNTRGYYPIKLPLVRYRQTAIYREKGLICDAKSRQYCTVPTVSSSSQ
ncbi:Platelet glycoprotein Ib alpha chain, partial [Exaiptasia diaphana]